MNQYRSHVLAISSISFGLLVAAPARAATLTQVSRSTWAGSASLPSYVSMYIYVPTAVAAKPPIVVSAHSCGSSASGQMGNITKTQAAADKYGFILILPDNPGQNCWDVGSAQSLKHDGGGDTQAVAQMVKYALSKYNGDASRVYIFGGSSGGMMTQAMLAVYPDVFRAGSARAGVAAGCWADGYDSSQQWSNTCAAGSVSKTAQQWGDLVRSMYPGYTGHRPRVQLIQGDADTTISYKNMAEAIKEWTNVLALSTTPTSTDKTTTSIATYDRQFWKNSCGYTVLEAWSGEGGTHSMGYEEDAILKFFGLDTASTSDPEPDCSGDAGVGGAGGSTSGGGTANAGGTSSALASGGTKNTGGTSSTLATGGTANAGGTSSTLATGGTKNTGGSMGNGGVASGTTANGGVSSGGNTASAGSSTIAAGGAATGGSNPASTGGATGNGPASTGGATKTGAATSSPLVGGEPAGNAGGCGCRIVNAHGPGGSLAGLALGLLGAGLRLRRVRIWSKARASSSSNRFGARSRFWRQHRAQRSISR